MINRKGDKYTLENSVSATFLGNIFLIKHIINELSRGRPAGGIITSEEK